MIPISVISTYRHCDERSEEAIHKQGRTWFSKCLLQEMPLLWIAASSAFANASARLLAMTPFLIYNFKN
jgi:hypothetical protein